MPIICDDSQWPILVGTSVLPLTDHDHIQATRAVIPYLSRKQAFVLIDDFTKGLPSGGASAAVRYALNAHRDELRRYCMGIAVVSPSPLWRAAMGALSIAVKPPMPVTFVATLGAAHAWAEQRLRDPGVHAA